MRRALVIALAALLVACVTRGQTKRSTTTDPREAHARDRAAEGVPFDVVGQGWMRIDVRVTGEGDHPSTASVRMMFDTGGGVTLLSKGLCDRIGCVPEGTFTGKRMSGQAISLQMARVASIELAGHRVENARVAVLDSKALIDPGLGIEGVAALDLFRDRAFTVDYPSRQFLVEGVTSSGALGATGQRVKVRVEHDGPSTVVFLPLELAPGMRPLEMEVDNGSLHMILDDKYMRAAGVDPASPALERVEGKDQTGQPYVRTYAQLGEAASVVGSPELTAPAGTTVMFQRIIHDGLLGHQFLSAYVVTFDLPRATLTFARPR